MDEQGKHKHISDASELILPECSSIKLLGAFGFLYTNGISCAGESKIVEEMLETPAEIVSTKKTNSFRQFELVLKSLKYVWTKINKFLIRE